VVYALVAIGGIFAIFLAQLLLSISLSGGAYRISHLLGEQQDLSRAESSLYEELQTVGSTQNLAVNAQRLGMVGNAHPAFIRLSNGKIVGSAAAAATGTSIAGKLAKGKNVAANSRVPNSLLAGVGLVDQSFIGQGDPVGGTPPPPNSLAGGAASGGQSAPPVTSGTTTGELPSPVTH
jgi:hypothetical protein